MLSCLVIKNIALIENLEVNFGKGLNILTGETGAGKSIIIDSVNFVLGTRADKSLIRYGCDSAQVSAYFDECTPDIAEKLREFDIEAEDELMLSRTMTADGKNTCRINGQKVTLSMLKSVAESLTDIYGQHDSVMLLKSGYHISVLDEFAKEKLSGPFALQSSLYEEYSAVRKKLAEYGKLSDIDRNIDVLGYQIKEIEDAHLEEGEEEDLLVQRKKLSNYEIFLTAVNTAAQLLGGDHGATESTDYALRELSKVSEYDAAIEKLCDRLDSCKIEISDIANELADIAGDSDFDERQAQYVYERIDLINRLKRKYGSSVSEILHTLESLKEQYDFYTGGEQAVADLNAKLSGLADKLYDNTLIISDIRHNAAQTLAEQVTAQLRELGMKNAVFTVQFNTVPDKNNCIYTPCGSDEVEFLFSANSGQPPRALTRIISGGELSRFMLALKNVVSAGGSLQTMIFDEVDTGISGDTAQVVAQKLYNIARGKQVLAVTHLPQLASMADRHYLISKSTRNDQTYTSLIQLDKQGMLEELARLIGGKNYSTHALPHAEEMKDYADNYKKQAK